MASWRSSRSPPQPRRAPPSSPPRSLAYCSPPSDVSYSHATALGALCSSVVSDLEAFEERDADSTVRGVLHQPRLPTGDGVVLAHGAGSNSESPVLRAV